MAAGVGYLISQLSDVFSWYAFLLLLPALPGMAFSSLNSMTLQGAGQPAGAQVADGIIRPLVTGALLVGIYFVSSPVGAEWAAAATAVACYAAYQWSTIRVRASIPMLERDVEQAPGSGWNADAGQFFLMSLIALLLARLDLLFIGWFVPASEVGIYAVSARLAELSALALVVSATTVAPMIAGYYSRNELAELQRLLVYSGRLVTLVTFSMFAGLVLLGEWLLDWYGEGFRQGYYVMLILSVGQLINAAAGPVGLVLTMTGRVRVALKFYAAAAIGSSLLMVMLVPSFGANGAAFATSAGMALWNIGMMIYVVRTMGIDPSMLGFLGNGKDL